MVAGLQSRGKEDGNYWVKVKGSGRCVEGGGPDRVVIQVEVPHRKKGVGWSLERTAGSRWQMTGFDGWQCTVNNVDYPAED